MSQPIPVFPLPKKPIRVKNDDEALAVLRAMIGAEPVARLLLGLPEERDPGQSWIVRKIRAFGPRLEEATGIPVEWVPEAFTTREAAVQHEREIQYFKHR